MSSTASEAREQLLRICWLRHCGLRWKRGAKETELAIEGGAAADASLCGRGSSAASPRVGGVLRTGRNLGPWDSA